MSRFDDRKEQRLEDAAVRAGYESVRLCSNYDPVTGMVCDLPANHRGAHRATCYWGDEVADDDND